MRCIYIYKIIVELEIFIYLKKKMRVELLFFSLFHFFVNTFNISLTFTIIKFKYFKENFSSIKLVS